MVVLKSGVSQCYPERVSTKQANKLLDRGARVLTFSFNVFLQPKRVILFPLIPPE